MNIAVLTSSRADYGIYSPLLKAMHGQSWIDMDVVVFGMHLLYDQGHTIDNVKSDGYRIIEVGGMPEDDSVESIAGGYGALIQEFSKLWSARTFDLVFALGDRWEMSAAVQSIVPFQYRLAHIHGGETTLGAIDNIYRHQISIAADLHFTANGVFSDRISQLLPNSNNIYTVGSLSLVNLTDMHLPNWQEIKQAFNLPFDDFVLTTIHPETAGQENNLVLARKFFDSLRDCVSRDINFLITGANSDEQGSIFNRYARKLTADFPSQVRFVKNLGRSNYFAAMKRCKFVLGNSSSGILEAASFHKYVINVGCRQEGRLRSNNVLDVNFDGELSETITANYTDSEAFHGDNVYYKAGTIDKILSIVKSA
jgi:GDP/UDP-N,N'-diacetylbacillosamine 2-epimerase (hydrolysing)